MRVNEAWTTPKPQYDTVSAASTTAISPELRGLETLHTRYRRGLMGYAALEQSTLLHLALRTTYFAKS